MVTDTECLDSAENILDSAEHNLFGFVVGCSYPATAIADRTGLMVLPFKKI